MLIKISQKTTYEHNTAQANTDDHYEFTIIYTAAQANTIQSIDSYTGYWNAYINKMVSLVVQSLSWGDQLNSEWFLMDGR